MFKKILFIAILFGITQLMAFDKYSTAMGLHFGTSSGNGYSIRHWGKGFSYQATFAAYTSNNDKPDFDNYTIFPRTYGRRTVSLGLNYLLPLLETKDYNFYLMMGGSYAFRYKRIFEDINDSGTWKEADKWTMGIGPGFEFAFSDRFHVSVELPMTVNHRQDLSMTIPAAGVYYYFK